MRPRIAFNREAFPKAARRRAPTPKASRNLLRSLPFLLLIRNQETSAKVFTEANEQNKDLVILQTVAKKSGLKFRPPLSSSTDFDRRSEAPAENPSVLSVWLVALSPCSHRPIAKAFGVGALAPIRVSSWLRKLHPCNPWLRESLKIC